MAILKTRRIRAAAYAGLALAALTLVGCVLIDKLKSGPRELAFSHRLHVQEEGLDCVSCHEDLGRSDQPGLPVLEGCLVCHEGIDEEKPPERQIASLFDDQAFRAAHASKLSGELVFSHQLHVASIEDCGACHRGIEENEHVDADIGLKMAACVECHHERSVSDACETCHREITSAWAPDSHHQNWRRRHGPVVRSESSVTADDCSMCHTESLCVGCHLDTPPEDHDNFFRRRGHGIQASMDRDRCSVCHRSDSCNRCHEEVRPDSHGGNWGGTQSVHCLTCHFPLSGESCAVCHKGTPSHLEAAPKPDWHTPAMNCRQCHGVGQPLPHVDKGDDCNACHL
jgi:hypothetical protein